jgi:hypothetical protein
MQQRLRELNALGLDRGSVEASLMVGDVASLRVQALHESWLALAVGCGCASDAERQGQSGQGDHSEERSHAGKDAGGMLDSHNSIYAKSPKPCALCRHSERTPMELANSSKSYYSIEWM